MCVVSPFSRQLSWALCLDGLVGIREASRIPMTVFWRWWWRLPEKSATVPLGPEWAFPEVLCLAPGASVFNPEESLRGPESKFSKLLGLPA
eukprot:4809118-Pyramimonas_sp.AAC.1